LFRFFEYNFNKILLSSEIKSKSTVFEVANISEEHVTSIFRVGKSDKQEPALNQAASNTWLTLPPYGWR
jgi:hypothetical protein